MNRTISRVVLAALITTAVAPVQAGIKDTVVNNLKSFMTDSPYFMLFVPLFFGGAAAALYKSDELAHKGDRAKSSKYLKLAVASYAAGLAVPITGLYMNGFFSKNPSLS
ncbi:MAG: hypothetical protein ACHQVS_05120 [Candidatus Babeliales bacterium]